MQDKVDAATAAVKETPPAMEKAVTALQEGEKLISLHQKSILRVDRSEHGWATVAEYTKRMSCRTIRTIRTIKSACLG